MNANEYLTSLGHSENAKNNGYVTRSRKTLCDLMETYAAIKGLEYFNDGLEVAAKCAKVKVTYKPTSSSLFSRNVLPEIEDVEVDKDSILKLRVHGSTK